MDLPPRIEDDEDTEIINIGSQPAILSLQQQFQMRYYGATIGNEIVLDGRIKYRVKKIHGKDITLRKIGEQ